MKTIDSPTRDTIRPESLANSSGGIVHFTRRVPAEPNAEIGLSGALLLFVVAILAGLVFAGLMMSGGAAVLFASVAFSLLMVVTLPAILICAAFRR